MTHTTLSISSSLIKYLAVTRQETMRWGAVPLAKGIIENGIVNDSRALADIIRALFEKEKLPRHEVSVSLAGLPFTYRQVALPPADRATTSEALRRAAKREIPMPLEDLYLSWQGYGTGDAEITYVIIGMRRQAVDNLVAALRGAGISRYTMEIPPQALARLTEAENSTIIEIEHDHSSIVFITGGVPQVMRTIHHDSGQAVHAQDEIERINRELSRIADYDSENGPQAPANATRHLLVTGELASERNVAELMAKHPGYHLDSLAPPPGAPPELPLAAFSTNLGLLARTASSLDSNAALPTRAINREVIGEAALRKPAGATASAILFAVAGIAAISGVVLGYLNLNDNSATVASLETTLKARTEQMAEIQESITGAEAAEVTIGKLEERHRHLTAEQARLLAGGADYIVNLQRTVTSLPATVGFSTIDIREDSIIVTGSAESSYAILQYVRNLENTGAYEEVKVAWIEPAVLQSGDSGNTYQLEAIFER